MKREIPTDPQQYSKEASQVLLRMQASADWYSGYRAEWEECYDIWNQFPSRPTDLPDDEDEYEIKLGYAFGLIEQLNPKITEPLLQGGPPCGVYPTELGDQAKADNFSDMLRDLYSKPNFQQGLRKSKKEMIICGPRCEVDEWLHIIVKGKAWGKVAKEIEVPVRDPDTQQPVLDKETGKPAVAKDTVMVDGEVDRDIILEYGFNTRFPRNVDIYPEPNRTTIDTGQKTDIAWFVEDLGELAIEDLMREVVYDPEKEETVRRYDFSMLLKDAGTKAQERYADLLAGKSSTLPVDTYGPIIQPVSPWPDSHSGANWYKNTGRGGGSGNDVTASQSFEDRDKIRVIQMRTPTSIITIANNKYIIEKVVDPWHRPRLGLRIENYTEDPRSLYGPGALTPVKGEVDELNITHSLGMQNFFRLVNRMLAVRTKAVVSMSDFDRRAGGIVRINEEANSLGDAVQPIDQPNVMNDVLAAESNIKGSIEFTDSYLDGSPGVQGTRQNHKTARGMEIIQVNLGTRYATMQSQGLINEARRGQSMMYMVEQFHFEPVSYRRLRDDGTTVYMKFTKEDINTQGRGFNFLVTVDPNWGNTQAQQELALNMLDRMIAYEDLRRKFNDPTMKKANISRQFEKVLKLFGNRDLTDMFTLPGGEMSPEDELQILMQGGVVECRGDAERHITTHLLQLRSPELDKAMAAGKVDPKTKNSLMLMIQQRMAQLRTFIADPQGAAAKKLNEAGMGLPPGGVS